MPNDPSSYASRRPSLPALDNDCHGLRFRSQRSGWCPSIKSSPHQQHSVPQTLLGQPLPCPVSAAMAARVQGDECRSHPVVVSINWPLTIGPLSVVVSAWQD